MDISRPGFTNSVRDESTRDDTASESMVEVDGEDFGSESAGFATPPQTQNEATALSVPSAIPEDVENPVVAQQNAAPEKSTIEKIPALSLSQTAITNGKLPESVRTANTNAANAGVGDEGMHTKLPPSRAGTSVKSTRGRSKKELAALLAGIGTEVDSGKEERKFTGMAKPPY